MNTERKTALVIVFSLVVAVTQAGQKRRNAPPKQSTYAEFKTLIDNYFAACNSLNLDKEMAFYAKDPGLVFYDLTPPLKYNGWQEYREGIQKAYLHKVLSAKLTPNDDLKVTRRGDVAWTTETFRFSVTMKAGQKRDIEARHTAIWEKRSGGWIIVHEHVSVPYTE
jgi:ketosteroid isomerase-like protein